MPEERPEPKHFEISAFTYQKTTSKKKALKLNAHVRAEVNVPKDKSVLERRIIIEATIVNGEDKDDKLMLNATAVAYFDIPTQLNGDALEQYIEHELFPQAYDELSRRIKTINESMGVPSIELPAYDGEDE